MKESHLVAVSREIRLQKVDNRSKPRYISRLILLPKFREQTSFHLKLKTILIITLKGQAKAFFSVAGDQYFFVPPSSTHFLVGGCNHDEAKRKIIALFLLGIYRIDSET